MFSVYRSVSKGGDVAQVFLSCRFDGDLGWQKCTGLRINAANLHPWTVTLPRRAPRLRVIQVSGSPIIDNHDERWGHGVVSREELQHLLLPSPSSLCDFVLKTGSHHWWRTGDKPVIVGKIILELVPPVAFLSKLVDENVRISFL